MAEDGKAACKKSDLPPPEKKILSLLPEKKGDGGDHFFHGETVEKKLDVQPENKSGGGDQVGDHQEEVFHLEADVVAVQSENKSGGGGRVGDHQEEVFPLEEILKKKEDVVAAQPEKSGGGGQVFHRDMLEKVVTLLPTKAAYRCCVWSKEWTDFTAQPVFLQQHLAPRPLTPDQCPVALVVQPRGGAHHGYVHVLVLGTDGESPAPLNYFPLHPSVEHLAPVRAPVTVVDSTAPEPDFIKFFGETAPALDLCIVASEGRLFLGTNGHSYYVCLPENNRSVKLPSAPVKPNVAVAAAMDYYIGKDDSVSFRVILVVRDTKPKLYEFTSSTAAWKEHLNVDDACGSVDTRSPGISTEGSFYWLGGQGHVVRYSKLSSRASVLVEPPLLEGWNRLGRSLGSVEGKLRFPASTPWTMMLITISRMK